VSGRGELFNEGRGGILLIVGGSDSNMFWERMRVERDDSWPISSGRAVI
jgi:hypothetical protein